MFLRSSGSYKLKVIAIILVLTTLACSVSGKNAATAVPSASAGPQTETPASVPATSTPLPPTLTPTNTEAPTEVPTSTPTLTPTAVPTREVGIGKKDILIHTGPDNKYPVTGSLTANQTVDVTARNSDGTWFELLPLEGRSGWIAGAGLAAGGSGQGCRFAHPGCFCAASAGHQGVERKSGRKYMLPIPGLVQREVSEG